MHIDEMGSASRDLALIEAALFLSPQPLTRRGLAKLLGGVQLAYVDQLLDELATELDPSAHGIELYVEDGRAVLRVRAEFVEQVAHLAPQQDIPRPLLRTLAVIAYNHPMTQADLVRVRGNKAYGHVQELLERRLIRAEEHGKTLLLHVTKEFLQSFGLRTVEEFRFHVAAAPSAGDDAEDETPETGISPDERVIARTSVTPEPLADESKDAGEQQEALDAEDGNDVASEGEDTEDDVSTDEIVREEAQDDETTGDALTNEIAEDDEEQDQEEQDDDQEVRDG
ncbi:SMC-Scp complex subunit ScpB [Candidatus Bipolaricaulota bacterium]